MSIDINYYYKIQNTYGSNDVRVAQIYETKNALNRDFNNTLDAYVVEINGVSQDLTIIKTNDLDVKKIKSRPDEIFHLGDIVNWHNSHWLINEVDTNNDIVTRGKMQECNYQLKWQNESGEIIERWCVTSRQSSVGLDENKVITLGKSELKILIPYDTETIKIRKGKRFYIDSNSDEPIPYETQLTNTTQYVKNGHGYLELIVKETTSNSANDRPDLMICDYFTPTPTPDPTPTTKSYIATISCVSATIRVGVDTKFKAVFKDTDGNIVNTLTPKWTITSDFDDKLTKTEGADYIQIGTKDKTLITKTFTLKLEATDDSAEPNEISISITSLF